MEPIDCSAVDRGRRLGYLRVGRRPNGRITTGTVTVFLCMAKPILAGKARGQELRIGQSVTIFYDPLDPARNAFTDFADLETNSLGPVPILLFGIGTVVLFIRYRRRRGGGRRPTESARSDNFLRSGRKALCAALPKDTA